MLARLFARIDMESRHLGEFFEWAITTLNEDKGKKLSNKRAHLVTGIMTSLFEICRHV